MVWVKICGITRKDDALKIINLGADALGFVLSAESARKIEPGKAEEIIIAAKGASAPVDNSIKPSFAGVFVNEDLNKVLEISEKLGLDYIQLSGDESPDFLKQIKKYNKGYKLIKLIRVRDDSSSFESLKKQMLEFKKAADFFLLDTYKKNIYGGTGKSFNWELAGGLGRDFPVILAGGLDCENVADAIRIVRPFGIDASTRLEESPGKKDMQKVEKFIENAAGKAG